MPTVENLIELMKTFIMCADSYVLVGLCLCSETTTLHIVQYVLVSVLLKHTGGSLLTENVHQWFCFLVIHTTEPLFVCTVKCPSPPPAPAYSHSSRNQEAWSACCGSL